MGEAGITLDGSFPIPAVRRTSSDDADGWAEVASRPIAVVVGAEDGGCLEDIPGNLGRGSPRAGAGLNAGHEPPRQAVGRRGPRGVRRPSRCRAHRGGPQTAAARALFRAWGNADELPFAGELDGDGAHDDVGVYRESDRTLHVDHDHDGSTVVAAGRCTGEEGCRPVVIPRRGAGEVVLYCAGTWQR